MVCLGFTMATSVFLESSVICNLFLLNPYMLHTQHASFLLLSCFCNQTLPSTWLGPLPLSSLFNEFCEAPQHHDTCWVTCSALGFRRECDQLTWLQMTRVAFFYWLLILQGSSYECFMSKDLIHGLLM